MKAEIIRNNENLEKFKEKLKSFFHEKTQEDFDKIEKNKLKQLIRVLEIIDKNTDLTEIDRALLDYAFNNKKPIKYCWLDVECKLYPLRFKAFRNFLVKEIDFGDSKNDFRKWVDWMINDNIEWDDGEYENKDKNFMVKMNKTKRSNKGEMREIKVVKWEGWMKNQIEKEMRKKPNKERECLNIVLTNNFIGLTNKYMHGKW